MNRLPTALLHNLVASHARWGRVSGTSSKAVAVASATLSKSRARWMGATASSLHSINTHDHTSTSAATAAAANAAAVAAAPSSALHRVKELWPRYVPRLPASATTERVAAAYQKAASAAHRAKMPPRQPLSPAARLQLVASVVDEFMALMGSPGSLHTPGGLDTNDGAKAASTHTVVATTARGMLTGALMACEQHTGGSDGAAARMATRLVLDYTHSSSEVSTMREAMESIVGARQWAHHTTPYTLELDEDTYRRTIHAWATAAGQGDSTALDRALALWHAASKQPPPSWSLTPLLNSTLHACARAASAASDGGGRRARAIALDLVKQWQLRHPSLAYSSAMKVLANSSGLGVMDDALWLLQAFVDSGATDAGSHLVTATLQVCRQHSHLELFRTTLFPLLAPRCATMSPKTKARLVQAYGATVANEMLAAVTDNGASSSIRDTGKEEHRLASLARKLAPHRQATTAAVATSVTTLVEEATLSASSPDVRQILRDAMAAAAALQAHAVTTRNCNDALGAIAGRDHCCSASLQAACCLFDAMRVIGGDIQPDHVTVSALLQCYAKALRCGAPAASTFDDAVQLFEQAQEAPLMPGNPCIRADSRQYMSMLNVCAAAVEAAARGGSDGGSGAGDGGGHKRAKELAGRAEELLQAMWASNKAVGGGGPCAPSVETYMPLLTLYNRMERQWGGAWTKCVAMLRTMKQAGPATAPSADSYAIVIDACAHAVARGHPKALLTAVDLLRESDATGGGEAPRAAMYGSVIKACAAGVQLAVPDALELALGLLREMQEAGGNRTPTARTYTAAITACAHAAARGDNTAYLSALELLVEAGWTLEAAGTDTVMYNAVLKACANAAAAGEEGASTLSVELVRDMRRGGDVDRYAPPPNTRSYNTAINACAHAAGHGDPGAWMVALELLQEASEGDDASVAPDDITYRTVLKACTNAAQYTGGEALAAVVQLLHATPAAFGLKHYASAIDACAQTAERGEDVNSWRVAMQLLKEVQATAHGDNQLDPTFHAEVLRAALRACNAGARAASPGALKQSVALLQQLQSVGDGGAADTLAYNTVIASCAAAAARGDVQAWLQAVTLLRDAAARGGGAAPDVITYSTVIKACAGAARAQAPRAVELGVELLHEMRRMGGDLTPTTRTYSAVIDACANAATRGDAEPWTVAMMLLREAAQRGGVSAPDTLMYNMTIKACARAARASVPGAMEQSLELLTEMHASDSVAPDAESYNTVIDACAAAASKGHIEPLRVAVELLQEAAMLGGHLTPTTTTYNAVLKACSGAARGSGVADAMKLSAQLFQEMQEHSTVQPDARTYNAVIDVYANAASTGDGTAMHAAVSLLREAASLGGAVAPNTIMYTTVIKACAQAARCVVPGALETAVDLLREMQAVGGSAAPDQRTYAAVIDACANATFRGNKRAWWLAFELLGEAGKAGGRATPNTVVYNAVIKACACAARQEKSAAAAAVQLLRLMQRREPGPGSNAGTVAPPPDARTYDAVIRACIAESTPPSLRAGLRVALDMCDDTSCRPGPHTIAACLKLCERSNSLETFVTRLLPALAARGARPNSFVTDLMIKQFGADRAKQLVREAAAAARARKWKSTG